MIIIHEIMRLILFIALILKLNQTHISFSINWLVCTTILICDT